MAASKPPVDYYSSSIQAKYGINLDNPEVPSSSHEPTADIGWYPDLDKFNRRLEAAKDESSPGALPLDGWPRSLEGPLCWTGSDLKPEAYTYKLLPGHIEEIEQAYVDFSKRGLGFESVQKSTFPLPTLGPILEEKASEIYQGKGFCSIRGLDPTSNSREKNIIIYLGITSYIAGERGRQTQDGSLLTHIADVKLDNVEDSKRRPIYTNEAQPFHTDLVCGVLAIYMLDVAVEGGEIDLASSWTVYNEIAKQNPRFIRTLGRDDWVHDTFGRRPPFYRRALLHKSDEKVVLVFARRNLTGSHSTPRSPDIPPMTDEQANALDMLQFTAEKHRVTINPARGDMVFVNNLAIMHSRRKWQDDKDSRRYMLRLWLHNPELGWKVPTGLELAWERIFGEAEEVTDYWDKDPFTVSGPRLVKKQLVVQPGGGIAHGDGAGGPTSRFSPYRESIGTSCG